MNAVLAQALKQFGYAVERAIVALEHSAEAIDKANPGDPYASLMLREDVETLREGLGHIAEQLSAAVSDVMAERHRQRGSLGWTAQHDDEHDAGELACAAAAYALAAADVLYPLSHGDGNYTAAEPPPMWPDGWDFKPAEPRRMLVKAAALSLAEIERIDREAARSDA